MDKVLELLKLDLGITSTVKDTYFNSLLLSVQSELNAKGLTLILSNNDDMMLLSDYAAWKYRKRSEDVEIPKNIKSRIRDRIIKKRSLYNG